MTETKKHRAATAGLVERLVRLFCKFKKLMNLSKINIHRFGFVFDRKTVKKKPFFRWNAPCFRIKIFCAIVIFPCFVESAFSASIEVMPEINDSFIVTMESANQNISNTHGSSWRHESGDFGREGATKLNDGGSSSIDGVIQQCAAKPDNTANNGPAQGGDNGEGSAVHVFIALLATLVFGVLGSYVGATMPIMYNHSFEGLLPNKPNAQVTGASND